MKNKKIIIPAIVLFTLLIGGTTVSAFSSDFMKGAYVNFSDSEQVAIEKASEIRQAAEEEARQVLEDAGVDMEKLHEARHAYMETRREEMDQVFESGDYNAYLELVAGTPMEGKVSEDDFDKLAEAHNLRQSGDYEGARAIMEELGLEGGFGPPIGRHGMGHMEW